MSIVLVIHFCQALLVHFLTRTFHRVSRYISFLDGCFNILRHSMTFLTAPCDLTLVQKLTY